MTTESILESMSLRLQNVFGKGSVFAVGGTSRDLLLGYAPRDYDLLVVAKDCDVTDLETGLSGSYFRKLADNSCASSAKFYDELTKQVVDVTVTSDLDANLASRDLTVNAIAVNIIDNVSFFVQTAMSDLFQSRLRFCQGIETVSDCPVRLLRLYSLRLRLSKLTKSYWTIDSETSDIVRLYGARLLARQANDNKDVLTNAIAKFTRAGSSTEVFSELMTMPKPFRDELLRQAPKLKLTC